MKSVIFIEPQESNETPVEFTHRQPGVWRETNESPKEYSKVVYLGKCPVDGDVFAAYSDDGYIQIFKGHLNSGKY